MAIGIGTHSVVVVVCFFWHFHFHYLHYLVISDYCFVFCVWKIDESELQQYLIQQNKNNTAAADAF